MCDMTVSMSKGTPLVPHIVPLAVQRLGVVASRGEGRERRDGGRHTDVLLEDVLLADLDLLALSLIHI